MSREAQGFIVGGAATLGGIVLTGFGVGIGPGVIAIGVGQLKRSLRPNRMSQHVQWQNSKSAVSPLFVVYGEAKVGMALATHRVFNQMLFRPGVVSIASGNGQGIEGVVKVWLDDELALDPPILNNTVNGTATGRTSRFSTFPGAFVYNYHDGNDAQVVDVMMNENFPLAWAATAKGLRLAYLTFQFRDPARFTRIPNVTALVRGVRVYDPRDPTGGPDADGWTWDKADASGSPPAFHPGQNLALQALDLLTSPVYGHGAFYPERDGGDTSLSVIDESSFIAAANHFDLTVQDGEDPPGTQARFEGNGWLSTADDMRANMDALLSACRSDLVFQGGKWRLVTRRDQAAVAFKLDESNILGGWRFRRGGQKAAPNRVVVRFNNEADEYRSDEAEWPEAGSNAFLTADNDVEETVRVDLPLVTNYIRAQQIGMVMLKEAREDIVVELEADANALTLEVGDVVELTHATPGWTDKEFWVDRVAITPEDTVVLTLDEFASSVYSLDPQDVQPTTPGTDLQDPLGAPARVTGLTATREGFDGVRLAWDAATSPLVVAYELRVGTAIDWATATVVKHLPYNYPAGPPPEVYVESSRVPSGRVYWHVKAFTEHDTESENARVLLYYSWRGKREYMTYLRDEFRKRKLGDADGVAMSAYDGTGLTKLYDAETAELADLVYPDDLGTLVRDYQPVEGASQKNRTVVAAKLAHLDVYTAPAGFTIYGAKCLGGASSQDDAKWGTKAEVDADTASGAAPNTQMRAAVFDGDGDAITALLYLQSAATQTQKTEAFEAPNPLTGIGATGLAAPVGGDLPADDDTYICNFNGEIESTKSGSYSITLVLKMRKDGGAYQIKDTKIVTGSLPGLEISGTLSGAMAGWDGTGADDAIVEITDVTAPGIWTLSITFGNLTWYVSSATYASMTPNGEKVDCEVDLIAE